ncbi:heat shock factor-type, DNA-binding protein [Tanacetum coccineum]
MVLESKTQGTHPGHYQRNRPHNKITFPTFSDGDPRGECYRCGKKYGPGHRCKTGTLKVLEVKEEPDEQPTDVIDYIAGEANDVAEISLHAILGKSHPRTMKVQVYGRDHPSLLPYVMGETKNAELEQQLIDRDDMLKLPRINLTKVRDRMRNQANSKRREIAGQPVLNQRSEEATRDTYGLAKLSNSPNFRLEDKAFYRGGSNDTNLRMYTRKKIRVKAGDRRPAISNLAWWGHLLKTIRRRRNVAQSVQPKQEYGPCIEVGQYGIEEELEGLKRDRSVLMAEIVRLRQLQQHSKDQLAAMENRLKTTERETTNKMQEHIEIGRKRRLTMTPSVENLQENIDPFITAPFEEESSSNAGLVEDDSHEYYGRKPAESRGDCGIVKRPGSCSLVSFWTKEAQEGIQGVSALKINIR